ncbi:uncharacterized protein N7473_006873 [Penicillium subrubescens]|uniref:Uncharacterized protein n=1 Tax=Penicillium subrubescens TaxID=1316194 RepID=A0A1Q5UA80_9EURO|nr:uncharacterized protein N7473_006873 [Penicillium subrubescens]KAJ5890645.1 hypothetical protein N7473_006873 [Penicillium subrubescens]OKP09383.1 hypothetical protein PENSUB_5274 [Penicillium subrubescens]
MARSDMQFGQDPAYPASKSRWSIDSGSRSLSKRISRKGSKASSMEDAGILNAGFLSASREPLPFPEYSDPSLSSEPKAHGSMRSIKTTPAKTPSGSAEKFDSSLFLSGTGVNDFADGLDHRAHKSKHMKPKVHIKPMLRKMSRDDATSQSIDLSRSSTEQEGLGIYLFDRERERRQSESLTGANYRRASSGLHNRSTSGASQFSITTGSSGGKPGSQYVYPLRPTPRSFTPPLSQSYQTSVNESDDPVEESPETEIQASQVPEPEHHRTTRASSVPMPRLSLQIDDDSFTRLPGISQTNVSGRPSFGYSRDNGSTVDTASPISRPSLDFMFRSRTRTSTSTDPASRAATIQAARQAFQEKEAAKARRLEKQQSKAEERQTRRLVKRTSPEAQNPPPAPPREEISEKKEKNGSPKGPKRISKVYDDEPPPSWKSQSKSTWVLFMTWLRTRVFKFRRRLRKMA